jgi:hypothetical protein
MRANRGRHNQFADANGSFGLHLIESDRRVSAGSIYVGGLLIANKRAMGRS